ncbi:hypothetical protein C0039_07160 [Pseudohalioglobus lutimaris]|uniref:Uncharacterized protein n=1 Tax=Pseudohalioglobus lutimaris TaxID=1737061 RepID=A0A2N5X5L6_9GAMM|nr:hypothetical protein C0039_07160 [Pseudohalioglobus lutimaris]
MDSCLFLNQREGVGFSLANFHTQSLYWSEGILAQLWEVELYLFKIACQIILNWTGTSSAAVESKRATFSGDESDMPGQDSPPVGWRGLFGASPGTLQGPGMSTVLP